MRPEELTTQSVLFLNYFIFHLLLQKDKFRPVSAPTVILSEYDNLLLFLVSQQNQVKKVTELLPVFNYTYTMFFSLELRTASIPLLKSKPITDSSSSGSSGVSDNLAQTDTNQPGADGSMPISVEGHATVTRIGGCCTEVG